MPFLILSVEPGVGFIWKLFRRGVGLVCWAAALCCAAAGQGPTIQRQPASAAVMLSQPVTFSVLAPGATQYEWIRDYEPVPNTNSSSYTFVPSAADTDHQYSVVVHGATGISFSKGAVLQVVPRTDKPTVSDVELFGTAAAGRVADSFGLGVTANQDWQYAAIQAMGGRWVRADACQWQDGEVQDLPSNTSKGFAFAKSAACVQEIQSARQHKLHLDTIAYWGAPHHRVGVVTVGADIAAGASSLQVTMMSGDLSRYPARDLLLFAGDDSDASFDVQRVDGGMAVDSVQILSQDGVITLTRPTIGAIHAGTQLSVHALLYPPVLLPVTSDPLAFTQNPSLQAWTRYVSALQHYIASEGLTGAVELWNEPENTWELWDNAPWLYKQVPTGVESDGLTSFKLALSAALVEPVAGVPLINGWSDVSGFSAVNSPSWANQVPVSTDHLNAVFGGDAMHVYGVNPEQMAWLPDVVAADGLTGHENFYKETPIGGQTGANFKSMAFYNQLPQNKGGIPVVITESGLQRSGAMTPTEAQIARFNVRQFLTFAGLGVSPIIFFKAGGDLDFEWFEDAAPHAPHPVATAFTGMLADLSAIQGAPAEALAQTALPKVSSYTGYFPLATTAFIGTRSGDTDNSVLFYAWQKTYAVSPAKGSTAVAGSTEYWTGVKSPTSVPVTLTTPPNMKVSRVVNTVTQVETAFTLRGSELTFRVTDDPVEVLLTPEPSLPTPTITLDGATAALGDSTVQLSATVAASTPFAGDLVSFRVAQGNEVTGTCSTSTATSMRCTATYTIADWAAGAYPAAASFAGDTELASTSSSAVLTISKASPTLTVATVTASLDQATAGLSAELTFPAGPLPQGLTTLKIANHEPVQATCTGAASPLLCTATVSLVDLTAGAVVTEAVFAGDKNYAGAMASGTMALSGAVAKVSVPSFSMIYGTRDVHLTAAISYSGVTPPTGAVTVAVGSDMPLPATCSGTPSSLVCSIDYPAAALQGGSLPLYVAMAAAGRFAAAAASSTLTVTPSLPVVAMEPVVIDSAQASGQLTASVSLSGMMAPAGALVFTIDGQGPLTASCKGAAPVLLCSSTYQSGGMTAGKHVLRASLASDRNYATSSATTTFTMLPPYLSSTLWVANGDGSVMAISPKGEAVTGNRLHGGGATLAVDGDGAVWTLDSGGSLSLFANTGNTLLASARVAGVTLPKASAQDSAGTLWVVDGGDRLTAVTRNGPVVETLALAVGVNGGTSVVVDHAGSIWITNGGDDSLLQVIGAGSPVYTRHSDVVRVGADARKP